MIIILICLETVYDMARDGVKDSEMIVRPSCHFNMLFMMSISPDAIRRYIRGRN
jgi:hypothetical protein